MRALRYIINFVGGSCLLSAFCLFLMMLGIDAEFSTPIQALNCLIASLLFGAVGYLSFWFSNLLKEADEEWNQNTKITKN